MTKLIGKLVGFAIFACLFVSAIAGILAISTGLIDLQRIFPGLPEPPQIETGGLPVPEGVSFPELPGITVPQNIRPGEGIPLGEAVQPRPLLASVPAPQQLSSEPEVIGTNVFLAILMALIFGGTSTILGNMLRDEEQRIQTWLRALGIQKLFGWVGKAFQWTLGGAVSQGCLTIPLVIVIFAFYGIIFAALEEGTSIFSRQGAFLAVTMAITAGLVSFSGDIARRIMGRIWRTKSRFNIYPVNLTVAIGTVIFSRLLLLTPGIAFGTPGGADVDMPGDKEPQREAILALVTLAVLVVIGGAGWALSGFILSLLGAPIEERLINIVAGVVQPMQDISLALSLVAIETIFFESVPLAYSGGKSILQWNKVIWAIVFIPVAFLFNHTLLNPQSGFLDSFLVSNVRFMWFFLIVMVGITVGLWFYFNVVDDALQEFVGIKPRRSTPPPPPPPPAYDNWGQGGYQR
ncbi:MAG: hypothetical protein JXB30_11570 [Anaerolineae bacterium]|nr:hypothetical protein [Anaerolineae bacterium]